MNRKDTQVQIIRYYQSQNQEHWKNEISKADWSAAKLLYSWLDTDKLKQICGKSTEIFLLTDGDNLASWAILAEQDEIDAPELSPWIGFVYTFSQYRGNNNIGKLINHICDVLKSDKIENVFISTEEIGLYEKYGFVFWKIMNNREGKPTRVYVKKLIKI